MDAQVLELSNPDCWPPALREVLERLRPVLKAWELDLLGKSAKDFDRAMDELRAALQPYDLRGYHFTRLTESEAQHIRENGMEPLSRQLVERRIASLISQGVLSQMQADRLLAHNQVADGNRRGQMWACFYPPLVARESGIRPLLEHWGGEALYNFNAEDPELGPVLRGIGKPAVVEIDVPISTLGPYNGLELMISKLEVAHVTGSTIQHPIRFEAYSTQRLDADKVHRVVMHPEDEFFVLTGADRWASPLK